MKDFGRFCLRCRGKAEGKYCFRCGSRLLDISSWDMVCGCEEIINPLASYCSNCGKKITQDSILRYLELRDEGKRDNGNTEEENDKTRKEEDGRTT